MPILLWFVFLLAFPAFSSPAVGAAEPFPVYDCLKSNVAFWEKIYSHYLLNQGVLHDSDNLDIVYRVIDLVDDEQPGAGRINRKRVEGAKKQYRDILSRLAAGNSPRNGEEKRVLQLFGDHPSRQVLHDARDNIRLQRGQKDRFREGVIRSGAYLATIKAEFRKHGLPEDLAYLAHVESSFNVQAYSKFGAAGIWQFTRGTGKRFMRVDYTIDERRDPYRASHAAALYLKENFERLGSWPLAITAYNHGANGMAKALRKKGDYESIFQEYEGRLFRFASRNFYSEFLAARHVAKNYRRYFGELPLARPPQFYELELAGFAPLAELADHFQLDLDTIARFNPALRNPLFSGQKYVPAGYRLRLPVRGGRMDRLAANLPDKLYRSRQKPSLFYEVRPGDTAGLIARRHGVSLQKLILANQLDGRATIYVGQNLRLPVAGETVRLAAAAPRQERHVKAAAKVVGPAPVLEELSKKPVASAVKTPESAVVEVVPQPQPVTVALAVVHSAEEAAVPPPVVGEEAALPAAPEMAIAHIPVNPAVVVGHLKVDRVSGQGQNRYGLIRVEVGETLGHYAEWLGVRAQDLRRLNHLRFGAVLHLNQQLKIPLAKVDSERFEEQRFEYHKEIEEDFFAAYRVEEMRNYQIRKGDNIWVLSNNKFEVPFWLIRKYNADTNFAGLRPNQELLVPVVEKIDERLSAPEHSAAPTG